MVSNDKSKKTYTEPYEWTIEELDMIVPEEGVFSKLLSGDYSGIENNQFKMARQIMGDNFISIEDVERQFGITDEQRNTLLDAPFPSPEIMEECTGTHILVPYTGLSILEVREKVDRSCFFSHEDSWYNDQEFAIEGGNPCWLLIRKTPVENSTRKTWEEQLKSLGVTDQVLDVRQMVYTIMLYYLLTRERLFEYIWVRTSSLSSAGHHVGIGDFDSDGLGIDRCFGLNGDDDLGISSSRKF